MRLLLLLALLVPTAHAQRALTHDDYEQWSRLQDEAISPDGAWAVWTQQPYERDATLHVRATDGRTEWTFARGHDAAFSDDGRFVAFRIAPLRDSTRQAKLDGKTGDELPRDSLGVVELATGAVFKAAELESMRLPEDGSGWMAYLVAAPDDTTDAAADAAGEAEEEAEQASEPTPAEEALAERRESKPEGHTLVVRTLATGAERRFANVTDYAFARDGSWLAFARQSEDGSADGVFALAFGADDAQAVMTGEGHYKQLAVGPQGRHVAFVSDAATFTEHAPAFALYTAGLDVQAPSAPRAAVRAALGHAELPPGWAPSEYGALSFSDSGARLFFGTAPAPEPAPEDTLTDDEKVTVDVWHWQDAELQPMQLLRADDEQKRTYRAALMLATGQVVQLAGLAVPGVEVAAEGDGGVALGATNRPYRMESSWEFPRFYDAYLVDVATGERRRVLERVQARPQLSPDGRYLTWFDADRQAWMTLSTEPGARPVAASAGAATDFFNQEHDWAFDPQAYGAAGWTEGDADLLVYDAFDVWRLDPAGARPPVNLTGGVGAGERIRLRVVDLDPDEPYVPADALLSAFDEDDKSDGFYRLRPGGGAQRLTMQPADFSRPTKAERDGRLLLTRADFRTPPDLYAADADLDRLARLSDANPQIADYAWGTAEPVAWTGLDGQPLEGLLYKPDGFDPERTYPLMVYFYEKLSDNLHRWHQPEPGRSVISIPFYVSRGYAVFVPDIPYRVGYPGESAVSAVMPGVTKLLEEGWVDRARVGVQGHSWGGYQIAYLVTQTDLFAAAGAGAPVSNMVSAYGGIRWGSGMSRMFQYERTQSRIGGSLWEKPSHYIHNSPIFQADEIDTPLLMMHNDEDGAVPWEQGIELFVALRRLGRPAWLLNYNGDPHWAMGSAHRRDYAVRMQQFFDHYLMGAPAPAWMTRGVPAVDKGRDLGLEVEAPAVASSDE